MVDAGRPGQGWIAVIGDRMEGFAPQDMIATAIGHSATALHVRMPEVRWIGTDALAERGVALLAGASGVWCAPGGPYRSLDGALAGIRWAREGGVPFLGTCAGFQHGFIEFARHVLGRPAAAHAEYPTAADPADLFIDELPCSLAGEALRVAIVSPELAALYGDATAEERYYCRFGLAPRWREPLERAGLRVAGVDLIDGDVRILLLAGRPFHVLTLFVPQTSSAPEHPHPLVTGFVREAARPRTADGPVHALP